ncbi:Transposase [Chitinispirillum alkaliphilum]|nr:Transposase [Chitinispirillum alkaliphilum]
MDAKDNPLSTPHDTLFRETFSRIETVRSFVANYVPKKISSQLNLQTLAIQKDSFIDKELSEHFSDILYSVKLRGKPAFLYLLFEHKSYIDPWTGFQLLRNMVKIWEQYRKQHKRTKKLPLIVPILIYQGAQQWKAETSITHLFENVENTRDYIPEFKTEVYDISHIPDEQIRGEILLRVNFLIQKYSRTPQLWDKLHEILHLLLEFKDKKTKLEYFEILYRYLSTVTDAKNAEQLNQEFIESAQTGGFTMPTIAEKWYQDGKTEGKIEAAQKMIELGMSDEQIEKITALGMEKIRELRGEDKSR